MRQAARAIIVHDNCILVIHRNKYGQEYYTLPGGGIDAGETPEQAIIRELEEETGVTVTLGPLVFTEEPGQPYGRQYIFLCTYLAGKPALHPNSEEAILNLKGQNTYEPMWLPLSSLTKVRFMSPQLCHAILNGIANGFPDAPEAL